MVGSVNNGWGMKLGKVVFDEEDNKPKITQNVAGVDVQEYIDGIKEAKLAYAKPLENKIEKNTKTLEALTTFSTKLESLQACAATMANRISVSNPAQSIFKSKTISTTTTTDAQFEASATANVSPFSMTVNQLASNDMKNFTVQAADFDTTALGITGTITLGTSTPGTSQTLTITNTMTLSDIQDLINSVSGTTTISAGLTLVSVGSPNNTYVLNLSAQDTGQSLVVNNTTTGGIIVTPSLPQNYLAGLISSTNENTALNLSGTLTVGSSGGTPYQVSITSGMTLTNVVNTINAQVGTTGVQASLTRAYNDSTGTNSPVFQLKLTAVNPGTLVPDSTKTLTIGDVSDTGGIKTALGLSIPVADYDTLVAKVNSNGTDYVRQTNYIDGNSLDSAIIPGVNITLTGASQIAIQGSISQDKIGLFTVFNEFVTSFNDLTTYCNEQTARDPDTGNPKENAFLADSLMVQKIMRDLRSSLANPVYGANSISGLSQLGYTSKEDGSIVQPQDMSKFLSAIQLNYSDLQHLFSNITTFSNSNFDIKELPTGEATNYVGQSISIHLENTSNVLSGTITIRGQSYPITVTAGTASEGGITFTIDDTNNTSGLKGINLYHGNALSNNTSDDSTVLISQGIMAKIDTQITTIMDKTPIDPTSSDSIPKGTYYQEIEKITELDKKNQQRIDEIKKEATAAGKRIEEQFYKVYQATIQLEQIMSMIESFNQVNGR